MLLIAEAAVIFMFGFTQYKNIQALSRKAEDLSTKTKADLLDWNFKEVHEDSKKIEELIYKIREDETKLFSLADSVFFLKEDSSSVKIVLSKAEYLNNVLKTLLVAADEIGIVKKEQLTSIGKFDEDLVRKAMSWVKENKEKITELGNEGQKFEKINFESRITKINNVNKILDQGISQVTAASRFAVNDAESIYNAIGFEGEKNYLLFFENNGDLRAGGGLISMFGFLKVKDGKVENIEVNHVYSLYGKYVEPRIPVPEPLEKFMRGPGDLTIYDSNWEVQPKFWLERAYKTWNKIDDRKVDGILVIGRPFLTDLVQMYEPLKIEDFGNFYSRNIVQAIDYILEEEKKDLQVTEKDKLLQKVVTQLMDKITSTPIENLGSIAKIIKKAADGRNIFIYLPNDDGTLSMQLFKNSIEMKPSDGDEFYMADSNLGSGKDDDLMKRLLTLQINGSGNSIETKANMHYDFTEAKPDFRTYPYNGYLRMVVPKDSKFNVMVGGTLAEPQVSNEFGWEIFGNYLSMTFNQKRDIYLKYELPAKIVDKYKEEGKYSLTLRKESGLELPYQIEIDLPEVSADSKVEATSGNVRVENGTVYWDGVLTKDSVISIKR